MKKLLSTLFAILLCSTLLAQSPDGGRHKRHSRPEPPKIEEMVSNLSAVQKKKLETITQNCKAKTAQLQKEMDKVRTEIRSLMDKEGDQSDKLFPLFDREAALQAQMSKEMYSVRIQIDQVLTQEQLAEFRARCKADRQKSPKRNTESKKTKSRK